MGQFFGIFTIEMTLMKMIMKDKELFKFITGRKFSHNNTSKQESEGYVDDISHISSNTNKDELGKFTKDTHEATVHFTMRIDYV